MRLPHGQTRAEAAGPTDGVPVLFVPGMTYPLEVFSPLVEMAIEAGHRCIRYDLYGRGGSAHDGTALTLDVLCDQLLGVLAALEPARAVHVVSLSNSDLLTARLVHRAPDKVRSLVWLAPTGFDRRNMNWRMRALPRLPLVQGLMRSRLRQRAAMRMAEHLSHLDAAMAAKLGHIYEASIRSVHDNPHFAEAVLSHVGHLPRDAAVMADLGAVSAREVPALAIGFGGEQDATEAGTTTFLNAVPQCQRVQIAQGHHMGLLDQADAVGAALLSFISREV
jgi:pimeloyl-ACP methyl ester carboxylesterase